MQVAIIGFGPLAREVIRQLKDLAEYGDAIRIYCVHVRRNSLSYGPDKVIEIVDKYGDGLRVYNDGFQATDYCTTVSSFEDWFVDEGKSYNMVVDCTSYTEDSVRLIFRVLNNIRTDKSMLMLPSKELVQKHWKELSELALNRGVRLSFNSIPSGDPSMYDDIDLNESNIEKYIKEEDSSLFSFRNGGPVETAAKIVEDIKKHLEASIDKPLDWSKAVRSQEWLDDAANRAKAAADAMRDRLLQRRYEYVDRHSDQTLDDSGVAYSYGVLDNDDLTTLKRFVVDLEGDYKTSEWYNNDTRCLVRQHEMLDWFFSDHIMSEVASHFFLEPTLVSTGARYLKYDSPESRMSSKNVKCPRVMLYAVAQERPWSIRIGDLDHYINPNEALLYDAPVVSANTDVLSTSGNTQVEYIEFHFAPMLEDGSAPKCTCFDRGQ